MTYTTKLGTLVVEVPSTVEIHPAWSRWRFTSEGRYLVAPDGQHITQERMEGILWRDEQELRLAGHRSRRKAARGIRHGAKVKVIVVELADWQARHFGTRAG
jgi:hypothetical protein